MNQPHKLPDDPNQDQSDEDLRQIIPFAKSWKVIYAFVLGELALLIILFYLFSQAFK